MNLPTASRLLLRADGVFLCVAGGMAMVMDAVGHFRGIGPLAGMLGSPHSIGGFEAHGLALILGVLIFRHATAPARIRWHWVALAVHVFLGGSNLLFWSSFEQLKLIPVGIATTAFHVLFVALHVLCLARLRK